VKKFISIYFLLLSTSAAAGFSGSVSIKDLYSGADGIVRFASTNQPAGTCDHWGWHLQFDASTSGGKTMLSTLLASKQAEKEVNIWYTDSSAPGTSQTNGCSAESMATLTGVSIP